MVFTEGWSNSKVEGSETPRRSPSSRANSVAPIESRPADIRGDSIEIAVPSNVIVTWVISSMTFEAVVSIRVQGLLIRQTAAAREAPSSSSGLVFRNLEMRAIYQVGKGTETYTRT
jgi:hypothetical protein